jgi:murein DD-endopeptidase MepM/ murein hydrolase activator NlpD
MLAMFTGGALGIVTAALRSGDDASVARAPEASALVVTAELETVEVLEPAAATTAPAAAAPVVAVVAPQPSPTAEPAEVVDVVTDRVRPGESLSVALQRHGVTADDVNALVVSLKGKVSLRGMRAGDVYRLEQRYAEGEAPATFALNAFEYSPRRAVGAPVVYRAKREDKGFQVEEHKTPVRTEVVALGGEVRSNLYLAMKAVGEGSGLVSRFVDVFAWDIDFYRQTQRGDSFKVVVEKNYAEGRFVGYGKVLAAEYVNAGETHRGFLWTSQDGKVVGTYDENGRAREKTFLKSPLEIARITSSYGQRFHPILKRKRQHNGVDYGASRGTPFWSVADGVVTEARYSRTAGNMIVIRHINGYETQYFHASRFADGIRPGKRVRQRDVIGYVGNTGRSTAPHLHFGMKKRGNHVDPGKQKFPAARGVPKSHQDEYREYVRPLLAELEALEIA